MIKTKPITGVYAMKPFICEDLNIAEMLSSVSSASLDRCFAQYIRALRQNWRQGTVGCKGRSDVAFSNKKPFKQKGTGRARQGASSSPLLRKGGVIFGPQKRTRILSIPQGMRAYALRALWGRIIQGGKVYLLDYDPAVDAVPNTGLCAQAFRHMELLGKKIAVITTRDAYALHASVANIAGVSLYLFDQINAYVLADADAIVCLSRDEELLKKAVQSWI